MPSPARVLRAELERFWPGPIGLFTELDSPISLAFLGRYPSPADARSLGEKRLRAFLSGQGYCGRQTPAQLLAKLQRAPQGRVGDAELAARRALVLALVAAITPLVAQIKALDRQIAIAVRAHPDGEIFLSLFKHADSVLTAAVLLAEIGDCRARYLTRDALAADAGRPRSQSSPANARQRASAGDATNGCGQRSADWLTAPATGIPGPPPLARAGSVARSASGRSESLAELPCAGRLAVPGPSEHNYTGRFWLRALWTDWSAEVRGLSGALGRPFGGSRAGWRLAPGRGELGTRRHPRAQTRDSA